MFLCEKHGILGPATFDSCDIREMDNHTEHIHKAITALTAIQKVLDFMNEGRAVGHGDTEVSKFVDSHFVFSGLIEAVGVIAASLDFHHDNMEKVMVPIFDEAIKQEDNG